MKLTMNLSCDVTQGSKGKSDQTSTVRLVWQCAQQLNLQQPTREPISDLQEGREPCTLTENDK